MNMPMGENNIASMIAGIRSSLDELEAAVSGEEQQPEEPIEGEKPMEDSETISEGVPVPQGPMKKKSALDRFAGM